MRRGAPVHLIESEPIPDMSHIKIVYVAKLMTEKLQPLDGGWKLSSCDQPSWSQLARPYVGMEDPQSVGRIWEDLGLETILLGYKRLG